MTKIYKKTDTRKLRLIARVSGLIIVLLGLFFALYTFAPLLSWELYLKPAFASNNFTSPIPQKTILTKDTIKSLLGNSLRPKGTWLPSVYKTTAVTSDVATYFLSIPKIDLENAVVSTVDTDVGSHLINFPGTVLPAQKGNSVIFGHSTLPQLYDPKNYKTIFAHIHDVRIDDTIIITLNNIMYTYKIIDISVTDAEDTSYLNQDLDGSYLTIVTCTPPGTTWKRLVIKSRLDKI
jgi:sortase A